MAPNSKLRPIWPGQDQLRQLQPPDAAAGGVGLQPRPDHRVSAQEERQDREEGQGACWVNPQSQLRPNSSAQLAFGLFLKAVADGVVMDVR